MSYYSCLLSAEESKIDHIIYFYVCQGLCQCLSYFLFILVLAVVSLAKVSGYIGANSEARENVNDLI